MSFDSWIALWSLESLWWTFGIFFAAALVEMWFPPFPGDAVYFVGLLSMTAGDSTIWIAILAAFIGSFTGFGTLFWLGQARGRRLFGRKPSGMWSEKTLHRLESWFQRWGGWVIIFGRFIAGIRSAVPLAAGVGSYPRTRALVLGGVSIALWNGLLAVAAIALGHNWEYVANIVSTYNIAFYSIAGIAILAWLVWRFFVKSKANVSKQG